MKRRNTTSTIEILEILSKAGQAMSHEMIEARMHHASDRATIYRVLNRFCEDGQVHRIVGDDGKQYFAWCADCSEHAHTHDHLHFRCQSCGSLECLNSQLSIELPDGYEARSHNLVVTGYCPSCQGT